MIAWYDPRQLAATGAEVVVSTILGRHADARLLEVFGSPRGGPTHDYSGQEGDFWIDYVADTGDGWNSTYAIARSVAEEFTVDGQRLERGRVLVLGGDEVYPVASRDAYDGRLETPYRSAFSALSTKPDVFAIPGNHDWYDSLAAFSRLFCQHRLFAGGRTLQDRSYFALKLPRGWWLIGTDVQLGSDIDYHQVEYFKALVRDGHIKEEDRIILCNAEPHWIYEAKYADVDRAFAKSNLRYLETEVFKGRVAAFISGDLHHYRRHFHEDGRQKIVAGGGGAFLHPTHDAEPLIGPPLLRKIQDDFRDAGKTYPQPKVSRALAWGNVGLGVGFFCRNPSFGALTAALYLMTAWSAGWYSLGLSAPADDSRTVLGRALDQAIASPTSAFWAAAVIVGAILLTDSHSKPYRIVGGLTHASAHVLGALLISWFASWASLSIVDHRCQLLVIATLIFGLGWLVGSFVMGLYLFISLNVFGRHSNEAFSSLAIEDYKNFLRLRINSEGRLTIYALGIDRVPRRWKLADNELWIPEGGTSPRLIDKIEFAAPRLHQL